MNMGVVGPEQSVSEVEQAVSSMHLPVTITPFVYSDYTETARIVLEHQKELDAVLFTGTLPFEYAVHYVHPERPWAFPPRDKLSLVFTLLKAGFLKGYDITKVSFDSIDPQMVYAAYKELGYDESDISIQVDTHSLLAPYYIDKLVQFHKEQRAQGKTRCAVTGVDKVYRLLNAENIPCMMNSKSTDSIIRTVKYLLFTHRLNHIGAESIATVDISIEYLAEHPVYSHSVLQLLHMKNLVRDRIYVFAQSIGAAVYEESENHFYLTALKSALSVETDRLRYMPLLQELEHIELVQNAYAGVGIADSPAQSKRSAELACRHARMYRSSCMYVIYKGLETVGPIVDTSSDAAVQKTLEKDISKIAAKSGVSIHFISRLDSIIKQYGVEYITTKQLAQLYGGSARNFQRMLTRLMDAGYVQVIGKEAANRAGRPSRIIQIDLGLE